MAALRERRDVMTRGVIEKLHAPKVLLSYARLAISVVVGNKSPRLF